MRYFPKKDGTESCVFSAELMDKNGDERKATFFGDAATKFEPILQRGKVYEFSKGTIRYAKEKYSKHKFEFHFNVKSEIVEVPDVVIATQTNFNFAQIADLKNLSKDTQVDVIGIIIQPGLLETIRSRSGKDLTKRVVVIADRSGAQIELTLWAKQAEMFSGATTQVLVAKGARVSNFNNCSLTASWSCELMLDPEDLKDARELQKWWEDEGSMIDSFESLSYNPRATFGAGSSSTTSSSTTAPSTTSNFGTKRHHLIHAQRCARTLPQGKAEYFMCNGMIVMMKRDIESPPFYHACATCNKKVKPVGDGNFLCNTCGTTSSDSSPRFILTMQLADHTFSQDVTGFDEMGKALLGCDAADLLQLQKQGDANAFEKVFSDVMFQRFIFKLRVKERTWNGVTKHEYHFTEIHQVNFGSESRRLLDMIGHY
eukprot:TRINITY_DN5434_c0_g1_i1.p1 TRINITY_DN5434_c0_g1~~TRINITY_DN5434_c0_g1_i1.p1  ORF type:complete len:428 (-),score=73.71 TRINITY_DN5434_c0_g1_i1:607-1890(-)